MMKSRVSFLLIVLMVSIPSIYPQESGDTTHITIYEDGSAFWELETRFELKTEADKTFFEDYVSVLEGEESVLIEEKKAGLEETIGSLNLTTQRSMSIENLDLSYGVVETITKDYGVVKFQFLWHGFAERDGDTLLIGDVFMGGYYLTKNETMIIEFPESYIYKQAYPPPDDTRSSTLIWYGPKTFNEKEPTLVLSRFEISEKESDGEPTETPENEEKSSDTFVIPILIGGVLIGVFLLMRNSRKEESGIIFSDEELIIDLLREKNGKYLQNDIVEVTGFSKSKVSHILNEMEEKGVITKKKMGRKNLIILTEN
jgi:uncharacterized membrane protein